MSFDHTYFYVMSQILIVAIHNETHYIIIIKVTTTSQLDDRLIISHGNTMTIHAILNEDCELFVRIRTSLKEIRVSQSQHFFKPNRTKLILNRIWAFSSSSSATNLGTISGCVIEYCFSISSSAVAKRPRDASCLCH